MYPMGFIKLVVCLTLKFTNKFKMELRLPFQIVTAHCIFLCLSHNLLNMQIASTDYLSVDLKEFLMESHF